MYSKETGCWKSDRYDETILLWCKEPFNRENPQAMFILADNLLEKGNKGKETSEAVYLMEKAAKRGYALAALAMGQLFQYGWAVSASKKYAIIWYQKAAELGNQEAAELLEKLKRQRRQRRIALAVIGTLLACAIIAAVILIPKLMPVNGILVHEDTDLVETPDLQQFSVALNDLIDKYDDELVITGQRGSNRLMLRFEGSGIDLSDFPADVVVDGGMNFLILQFSTEEEAQRCLKLLQKTKGVILVQEDTYETVANTVITPSDFQVTAEPYQSPYTGFEYLSWGVEFMGMDQLSAWLSTQQTQKVTVAVLDSGSQPAPGFEYRYLPGIDLVDPNNQNGWNDGHSHGTHVAGTIIDCTQGLDVEILPVRVLDDSGISISLTSTISTVVLGIQYATQSGADIINMSLGGPCYPTDPDQDCGNMKDLYTQEAIASGISVIVSAGNGDDYGNPISTTEECPAHIGNCIVVAACDWMTHIGDFSNYGESVDVCAPGVGILSYVLDGQLGWKNGTSMATPHISALAAMILLTYPDTTPAEMEKYITDYCVQIGDPMYYGEGIPWAGYFAGV